MASTVTPRLVWDFVDQANDPTASIIAMFDAERPGESRNYGESNLFLLPCVRLSDTQSPSRVADIHKTMHNFLFI